MKCCKSECCRSIDCVVSSQRNVESIEIIACIKIPKDYNKWLDVNKILQF